MISRPLGSYSKYQASLDYGAKLSLKRRKQEEEKKERKMREGKGREGEGREGEGEKKGERGQRRKIQLIRPSVS